jgi:hypothetical protein
MRPGGGSRPLGHTAPAGSLVLGLVFDSAGADSAGADSAGVDSAGADDEPIESLEGDFGEAAGHGSIHQRWHGGCRFACMAQSPRVELPRTV